MRGVNPRLSACFGVPDVIERCKDGWRKLKIFFFFGGGGRVLVVKSIHDDGVSNIRAHDVVSVSCGS